MRGASPVLGGRSVLWCHRGVLRSFGAVLIRWRVLERFGTEKFTGVLSGHDFSLLHRGESAAGRAQAERVPRVTAALVGVGDEHTAPAVGGELVLSVGDGILLSADDPRGVLAFGIGDLPGIVGQRPRDVPGMRHQTITAAASF